MTDSPARPPAGDAELLTTELVAVVVAVPAGRPTVLTIEGDTEPSLPSGPLRANDRSLQAGLRSWVEERTGHRLGHVEQLYTFADRGRLEIPGRAISVSYLALAPPQAAGNGWLGWYDLFPWEDRRCGRGERVREQAAAALRDWAHDSGARAPQRLARVETTFGTQNARWIPELCLQRYELLWEAGLVTEATRDAGRPDAPQAALLGTGMLADHRRILATGLARLRAAIQYRPVVFELMPQEFTLGQLQGTVEAIAGTRVHTQNFRRLIQQQELVEATGGSSSATGGRPARLYRFRREVLSERHAAGTKLAAAREPR